VNDAFAGEDLTRRRDRAQACGEVEGAAAVPAVGQRNGLPRIEADADSKREPGSLGTLLAATALHLDGRAEGLTRRGEDDKRLVTAKLDQIAVVFGHDASDDVGERRGEGCGGLVTVLLREACVAADVRDQEGANDRDRARARVLPPVNLLVIAVDGSV
jgi:hypothetical protein